jgi:hypothetical protein
MYFSMIALLLKDNAFSTAGLICLSSFTMLTPMLEPSVAGLTTQAWKNLI